MDFGDGDRVGHGSRRYCIAVVPILPDANTWLRWSGDEYEAELYAVGERVDIGTETQADLLLYSSANPASKRVTTVAHCSSVVVRKVGGTSDLRWYFVETREGQHGWISQTVIAADICIG